MARVFAAYVRGVPFIKEQVDAFSAALAHAGRSGRRSQSTLGRTAIRQIETLYIADLMVEWVNELVEAIKGGDSEYFREPARLTGDGTGFWEAPRGALYHSEKVATARSRATRSSSRRRGTSLPSTATASTARSSRRSSAFRWPTSRSPSTPCARFTPSTPAPLAPCMSRSAVPASTSRPSPALGG